MALKLDLKRDRKRWPVKVRMGKEGGGYDTMEFVGTFRVVGDNELTQISQDSQTGKMSTRDVAEYVLLDWEGVMDVEGNELDYKNVDHREAVFDFSEFNSGVVAAFYDLASGGRVKNSY